MTPPSPQLLRRGRLRPKELLQLRLQLQLRLLLRLQLRLLLRLQQLRLLLQLLLHLLRHLRLLLRHLLLLLPEDGSKAGALRRARGLGRVRGGGRRRALLLAHALESTPDHLCQRGGRR